MIAKMMFRLLPTQILLAAVGAVNGIVSGLFASNSVGVAAMSAVGLYAPFNMFVTAVRIMLSGGAAILCGKYMGRNQVDKTQDVFSLDVALSAVIAALFAALLLVLSLFDLTGVFTKDPEVRRYFNQYLLGQAIGVLPLFVGNQLPTFLSMERKSSMTMTASLVYIAVNVVLNFLFVKLLHMEAFGLALASSLGIWVFFFIVARHFMSPAANMHFRTRNIPWRGSKELIIIGIPGAAANGYETLRGIIVNHLIMLFVGSAGLSAFAASDQLLRLFWSIPVGMIAVSRLLMSVSIGEEDRQTLTDIMRTMFSRFVPLMYCVSAAIILLAVPLTRLFYRDPSEPVYMMTVWGFRILPLCMPLSIICMHFVGYGQASGKQVLVHLLSLLDGVVCVAGFSAILIRFLGMNSVYIANVLNGVVTTLVIVAYAWIRRKRFPTTMDALMVIPEDFGVPAEARLDLTLRSMEEVVNISQRIESFCRERGLDARRSYLAGLCMEEMAGNVVDHGFTKDRKKHSVDVRVVHKDNDLILRIKDDCVPFDPAERQRIVDPEDAAKNIGIRMVYSIADDITYQNILGMNVLTIRL